MVAFHRGAGGGSGSSASRKILKYINKITQSKYFKHAAEIKYIKKAMEEVSNTPLVLTVEIRNLSGTLALNIPPPPSDRLWLVYFKFLTYHIFIYSTCTCT